MTTLTKLVLDTPPPSLQLCQMFDKKEINLLHAKIICIHCKNEEKAIIVSRNLFCNIFYNVMCSHTRNCFIISRDSIDIYLKRINWQGINLTFETSTEFEFCLNIMKELIVEKQSKIGRAHV